MVAAVLVELEGTIGIQGQERGALLRHSAPQHQPTDPCTTLARADKRLLDAYEAGAVTLAELSERRHHLADERLALERQQQERDHLRRQRVQAEAVRTSLEAFCDRIHARLNEATFADKQAILQLVIERIIVGDGRLEIRHVIPLRPRSRAETAQGNPLHNCVRMVCTQQRWWRVPG